MSKARLRKTAEHFEGLFIQMMMKSMRDANAEMKSDLVQSDASDQFESMFDKELSCSIWSERDSMGLCRQAGRIDCLKMVPGKTLLLSAYGLGAAKWLNKKACP
jgi:hypothetical protein